MFACNRLHVPRLHGDADRAAHKSVAIQSTGTLSSDGGCQLECAGDQRYTGAYLFGAVCPGRGDSAAVVLPLGNAEAMNVHAAEISRHMTEGTHAVLVLDQAGWHTSPKLRAPESISPLPLCRPMPLN
jgi:hypothetical protein